MPGNLSYIEDYEPRYQQRMSDYLDFHDKEDRKAAIKKTVSTPSGVRVLALTGFAGAVSIIIPPVYFVSIPLVFKTYKTLKVDFDANLDGFKLKRVSECYARFSAEGAAEMAAFEATQARYDNQTFSYPPDYTELSEFPPTYDDADLFRLPPEPIGVKATSF